VFYGDLHDAGLRTSSEIKITPIFHKLSSYINRSSTGSVQGLDAVSNDPKILQEICNKHVLVIEDIYDTGTTMKQLLIKLGSLGARSLRVAIAFHKRNPANLKHGWTADYTGF